MSLKVRVVDPAKGTSTSVCPMREANGDTNGGLNGSISLTDSYRKFNGKNIPFTNSEYGAALNQDATAGGTPLKVHDGADSVYWTGNNIVGTSADFNNSTRPQNGVNSVYISSAVANDIYEFNKGSTQDLTNYSSLSMGVNVDRRWTSDSVEIYGWDGTIEVGNRVKLENYIVETDYDVWQQALIPLTDMGLNVATIEAIRFEYVTKSGPSSEYYLDDIQFEETAGDIEYRVTPPTDEPYHIYKLRVSLADALPGTVTNGTMPGLAYNKLLGLTQLSNGITFRRFIKGVQVSEFTMRDLFSFMVAGFNIVTSVSDGTNTALSLEVSFTDPIILDGNGVDNYISITIKDDLTGLLELRAMSFGSREV